MRNALIGYTGFVGGNLKLQYDFTEMYNSKNIQDMIGKSFDLCICAGVKAQKWPANQNPEKDWADIQSLIDVLEKTEIKKFVLISTVDVYSQTEGADENSEIDINKLQPYGLNRYRLEEWVREHFEEHLILRLPGLVGQNIKKNFIHDILHPVPALFNELFFESLKERVEESDLCIIQKYYPKVGINYTWNLEDSNELRRVLNKYSITSLMFTDSEDVFQYYDLSELKNHIEISFNNNIRTLNLVTEPMSAKELYYFLFEKDFVNNLPRDKQYYNLKSKYAKYFNGDNGYLHSKLEMFERIKLFIEGYAK